MKRLDRRGGGEGDHRRIEEKNKRRLAHAEKTAPCMLLMKGGLGIAESDDAQ